MAHTCTHGRQRQKRHKGPVQEFQYLTNWSLGKKKGENREKEIIKEIIQGAKNWKDWSDGMGPKTRSPVGFLGVPVPFLGKHSMPV